MVPGRPIPEIPFVGRTRELAAVEAVLERALSGGGCCVLVSGDPGVGKTRLADEISRRASRGGWVTQWGRCWESGGAPPYWPWLRTLRDLDLEGPTLLGSMAAPRTLALESAPQRFAFFDRVAGALTAHARRSPRLFVLDDLHAADPDSLLLLLFLARSRLRDAGAVVVGTYREMEGRRRPVIAALLDEVARESLVLPLSGLSSGEVGELVCTIHGEEVSGEVVRLLYEVTGGNPFFVAELSREQVERRDEPPRARVPGPIQPLLSLRVAELGEATRSALEVASVIGLRFELSLLSRAAGPSLATTSAALEPAIASGFIRSSADDLRTYEFRHSLLREALYDGLDPSARCRLHASVVEALVEVGGESRTAALAHHSVAAGGAIDVARSISWNRRAGEASLRALAFEEAATWFATALRLAEAAPRDDLLRSNLLLSLGEAHDGAGRSAEVRATFFRAAEIIRGIQDARSRGPRLARAALGAGRAWPIRTGTVDHDLARLLEEALGEIDEDGALRARLLARLACEVRWAEPCERTGLLGREALRLARKAADSPAIVEALVARHGILGSPDDLEERMAVESEVIRLAQEMGDARMELIARSWRIAALLEKGRIDDVRFEMSEVERLADRIRHPYYRWWSRGQETMLALLEGRLDDGERLAAEALADAQAAGAPDAVLSWGVQMETIRRERGGLEELLPAFRELVDAHPLVPVWRCGLASLYAELGDLDAARSEFERLAADDFADLPRDSQWSAAIAALAETCHALGDPQRAKRLYELFSPYADRHVVVGLATASYGSVSRSLGLLAAARGRLDEAEGHFRTAIAANRSLGARPFVVRTQWQYGCMLVERNAPGDRDRAAALFDEALEIAEGLGLTILGRRIAVDRELLAGFPRPAAEITLRRDGSFWIVGRGDRIVRLRDARGLGYVSALIARPGRDISIADLEREVGGATSRVATEAARVRVTKALRAALRRIRDADPALGRHLANRIRTGKTCRYEAPEAARE